MSGNYQVYITNNLSSACTALSDVKAINVRETPGIPAVTAESGTTFCVGDSVKLIAGIVTDATYSWFRDGGLLNSFGSSFVAKDNGSYTVLASFTNGCNSKPSTPVAVIVNSNPTPPSLSYGETTVCQGNSVNFVADLIPSVSFQWLKDNDIIPDATINSFAASESGNFSLKITNTNGNGCWVKTNPVKVTVNPLPATPLIEPLASTSFCSGDSLLLQTAVQAGLVWVYNGDTINANNTTLYAKSSGKYLVNVSNSYKCAVSSVPVILTMNPAPTLPSVSYGGTNICEGSSVVFSVTNNPLLTYQWLYNNGPLGGATLNSYAATKSGEYCLQVFNGSQCSAKTTPVAVVVNETPVKPIVEVVGNKTSYCPGTEVELNVKNAFPDLTYQWKRSGNVLNGANQTNYKGFLPSGDYLVEAKIGECSIESDPLSLTAKPAPAKPTIYAKGPNVWLLACDNMEAKDYRWYYNDQMILGAKTNQYVANQNLGNYYVEINDGGDCYTASDVINIPTGNIVSGVPELIADAVLVHPNPSTSLFYVSMGGTLPGALNVEIIDAFGRLVATFQYIDVMDFAIDLANSPDGVYFCKLSYQNGIVVKRIVKQ